MNEALSGNELLQTISEFKDEISKLREENNHLREKLTAAVQERRVFAERIHKVQKMEAISLLAGGIAHDFNNILASLIGFTELALDDTEKGSAIEDNLQETLRACKRAENLVKQILNFTRQTSGENKPIQIDLIAKEVLKFMRSVIPTTISINKQIRGGNLIMADPATIHQVLLYLCTKSAQAMEENGGILQMRLNNVTLDEANDTGLPGGDYVELMITDTGKGIPEEQLTHLFQPHDPSGSTDAITDFGMPMVYGIVKKNGGEILVQSQEGFGTFFQLYFPAYKEGRHPAPFPRKSLPTGKETILLVDDEVSIVKMGLRTLTGLGYNVTAVTSSVEALERFTQNPDAFDLIITDTTMPKITGLQLAREIRTINDRLPIILISGYSPNISTEVLEEMDIHTFLPKPFLKEDLAQTVRNALDAAGH